MFCGAEQVRFMPVILIIFLVVAGLVALCYVAMFILAMTEKQYLTRDLSPVQARSPLPVSAYATTMKSLALDLGFANCGDFYTRQGASRVRGNCSLGLSSDGNTLCEIADGKIGRLKHRKTQLISKSNDGQLIVTTDEAGIADLTGVIDIEILLNGDLPELHSRHEDRLASISGTLQPFQPRGILEQREALEMDRGKRLVDAGLAVFLNMDKTIIRHTARGAWQIITKSSPNQRPELSQQTARVHLKRPGDQGYRPSSSAAAPPE